MSDLEYEITHVRDHADMAPDGTVKLYLEQPDAGAIALRMSLNVLESLAVRATELFRAVRNSIGATSAPLETTVGRAMGISVQAAIGVEAVILSIADEHGLVHRFALHPLQSAELRPQMRKAEITAMNEARQTRQ